MIIEQYSLQIGIGIILLTWFILNKPKFKYQRRISLILVGIGVLFLANYFSPKFGFTVDLKSDLSFALFLAIINAILADIFFKKKLDL